MGVAGVETSEGRVGKDGTGASVRGILGLVRFVRGPVGEPGLVKSVRGPGPGEVREGSWGLMRESWIL